MDKKRIVVGATGASGFPVLYECLRIIREQEEAAVTLILSEHAKLTYAQEMNAPLESLLALADEVCSVNDIGAGPASGTYRTNGMLIVPCSMKTLAGIHSGYAENLLLRTADVTMKEHRTLVLGVRETPLSPVHLKNMLELSMMPCVRIVPLMMTFYHKPQTIGEMTYHMAAKLLEPLGIEAKEYRRWKGL